MNEDKVDSRDPGFLISRDMDGDLTPDERREMEARMASDPTLRDEQRQYQKLDEVLGRWAESGPRIDWARFHTSVLSEARSRRLRTGMRGLVVRMAAPLAAAAAVLIFIWPSTIGPNHALKSGGAYVHVRLNTPTHTAGMGAAQLTTQSPMIRVAFARDRVVELPPPTEPKMMIGLVERTEDAAEAARENGWGTF